MQFNMQCKQRWTNSSHFLLNYFLKTTISLSPPLIPDSGYHFVPCIMCLGEYISYLLQDAVENAWMVGETGLGSHPGSATC